jgi:hypothetical protein
LVKARRPLLGRQFVNLLQNQRELTRQGSDLTRLSVLDVAGQNAT